MGEQSADSLLLPWTVFHPDTNWLETLKSHINAIEGNKEKLHLTAEKLFLVCLRLEELRKPKNAGGNHHVAIKRWNHMHRRERGGEQENRLEWKKDVWRVVELPLFLVKRTMTNTDWCQQKLELEIWSSGAMKCGAVRGRRWMNGWMDN